MSESLRQEIIASPQLNTKNLKSIYKYRCGIYEIMCGVVALGTLANFVRALIRRQSIYGVLNSGTLELQATDCYQIGMNPRANQMCRWMGVPKRDIIFR